MRTIASLLIAGLVTSSIGCNLDVPDLNNPGIDELEQHPTEAAVSAACTGLLIGSRRNTAQANGLIAQLGILGREAYNFDQADPRFVGELLGGTLNSGSPFGGNFWAGPYANIRLANIIQRAVTKVADFTADEQAAIVGFSETIEAMDLLEVIKTRDDNGAVIDTDRALHDPLAPIVGKAEVYAEIVRLLDHAATNLPTGSNPSFAPTGGVEFPFPLSEGYKGFETTAGFLAFNRAIRARVAAYMKDYPAVIAAVEASFINKTPNSLGDLDVGVYHAYSTGTGDQVNNLVNPNIYAHPSLQTDAKNGTTIDARFTRKVTTADKPGSAAGLTSNLKFTIYPEPGTSVPIIRNEELLLLLAEAQYFTGLTSQGLATLNLVRTVSGKLPALAGPLSATTFTDALLYERRYSLMFEGHRLVDARRFDRTTQLPLDKPDHVRNIRYPIPLTECNARPGEPACGLGSIL